MQDWIVTLPERLDTFLAKEGRLPSRAKAQQAIEGGLILVNDDVVRKPALRLQEGDRVSLAAELPRSSTEVLPRDLLLDVLYEDDACLVLHKPAAIAVHPGAGMQPDEATILHGIAHLFAERGLPFFTDSVLAHRLDRETTGCLLVAKTQDAHRELQKQFEARTIGKTYLALVAGVPSPAEAIIDAPIGRATFERTKMSVIAINHARQARTTYRIIDATKDAALLRCELHTGRTHQLRVHLSAIGYPILGDLTYTSTLSERLTLDHDIRSLCLHAWKLSFTSPNDHARHAITAPLPAAFGDVLKRMNINVSVS